MKEDKLLIALATVMTLILVVVFIGVLTNKFSSPENLELTYKTNGGVPYEWKYEIGNKDVVVLDKSYVAKDENKNGMVGAPIETTYVFRGLKEGKTTITFKYVSIVDGSVSEEEKHNVTVDKNLNVIEEK